MFRIALLAVLALVAAAGPCFPQAQPQAPAASGDVWPTTPGAPQPPSLNDRKAKAEEKGRELDTKLKDDEELIRRYVRPGMGVAEIQELLGEPRGAAASVQAGRYLCLGYGRIWVVFEDGHQLPALAPGIRGALRLQLPLRGQRHEHGSVRQALTGRGVRR